MANNNSYIRVFSASTIEVAAAAKKLINTFGPDNINRVQITKPDISRSVEVRLIFNEALAQHLGEFTLFVNGLSAGFPGTGPHDLVDVLRYTGISEELVPEKDIYAEDTPILPVSLVRDTDGFVADAEAETEEEGNKESVEEAVEQE